MIYKSTAPYKSAEVFFSKSGKVNSPGADNHGEQVTYTVWREYASMGYKTDFQSVVRYTWEIRFPGKPEKSYRRKCSGKSADAKMQREIAEVSAIIEQAA